MRTVIYAIQKIPSMQEGNAVGWIGLILSAASVAYSLLAVVAVAFERCRRKQPDDSNYRPPVTVLKPLCGDEPRLYEALRSFCVQDYPLYQIVFGVREGDDDACRTVERLTREFPSLDMKLVVDGRVIGKNLKISNLANMMTQARYNHIVISDSDVIVEDNYLGQVVSPLENRSVGLVTCIYRARALGYSASRFGALFIDGWFMPAVLVSRLLRVHSYVSGVTMAMRRDTLSAIGGFESFADSLADDYMLGQAVRRLGLLALISLVPVETVVAEKSLSAVARHELRWMSTIRSVQPVGYAFSGITCGVTLPLAGVLMGAGAPIVVGLLAGAILLRVVLHCTWHKQPMAAALRTVWLLPMRDIFVFGIWVAGFFCRNVNWRENILPVSKV
ncbi:MAG: bacteriohopanetetrol glucosamine biosynthesis glycosyltransferase HpnI [Gammaproteobacteria bacterium]